FSGLLLPALPLLAPRGVLLLLALALSYVPRGIRRRPRVPVRSRDVGLEADIRDVGGVRPCVRREVVQAAPSGSTLIRVTAGTAEQVGVGVRSGAVADDRVLGACGDRDGR